MIARLDEISPDSPLRTKGHELVETLTWGFGFSTADALCQCGKWIKVSTTPALQDVLDGNPSGDGFFRAMEYAWRSHLNGTVDEPRDIPTPRHP